MPSPRHCERCQALLPPDAPEGLCPACLVQFAFAGNLAPSGPDAAAGERRAAPAFVFGDFEVQEEIARGGMGVVYRARQISLNRAVALKVILVGRWASEAQIERFQREAEAAARLNHPHIVPVHEVGQVDGQHYLSMPLIEGGNLAERLEELRTDPTHRRGIAIVAKVARAVHHAHSRGILHRDLKPTNVLLDRASEPHLTDFGLAKVIENDGSFTRTVAILGTPNYMAPEQASGQAKSADARADVYSVGAILYELLTGCPPFAAPTPLETLELVRDVEPRAPSRLNPRVDRDLETICLKCLRKEPSGRYASAEALAGDLERWLEGRPILARRASAPERLWRWSRRQPAAAAVVALLALVAAGLLFAAQHWRRQRDATRRHLWESLVAQSASIRSTSEAGRRARALGVIRQAARIQPSLEVRNEAIAALALPDLALRRRWAGFPEGSTAMALEPRHRHYARSSVGGRITVRELEGDRELAVLDGPSPACDWLRFSPDGQLLAARYGSTTMTAELRVWDWARTLLLLSRPLPQHKGVPVEFTSDGRSVFVGGEDGTIEQFSLPAGHALTARSAGAVPAQLACSPDDRWLAVGFNNELPSVAEWNARVRVLDLKSNAPPVAFLYHSGVRAMAWHPKAEVLAVGCNDYSIYEEEVPSGKRVKVYERQENPVLSCAYSSDGAWLASLGYDGNVIFWDAPAGRRIVSTRVQMGDLAFATASPRLGLGLTPPETVLWEIAPQHVFFEIPQTQLYCSSASFSPDGRWFVEVNPFGGVLVSDLDRRRTAGWHIVTGIRSAWFEANGRHLLTSGHAGLQRWPFEEATEASSATKLGPPARVDATDKAFEYGAASRDGRWVALSVEFDDVLLGELGKATSWQSMKIRGGTVLTFSPEGRWLATVPGREDSMSVWELPAATRVFGEPAGATAVCFSPDGRWLVAAVNRDYRLWQVGSWKLQRVIQGEGVEGVHHPADFSPDGRTLAVVRHLSAVQLVDTEGGEELATLKAPDSSTIQWIKFSPDARRLAVVTRSRRLQVWDLPALRTELTDLGLDWTGRTRTLTPTPTPTPTLTSE